MRRAALLFFVLATACKSASEPPASGLAVRSCEAVVWHQPASASAHVEVVGDWNDWQRPGLSMAAAAGYPGWLAAKLDLPPGEHTYAIIEDGQWLLDPNVATTAFHEGQEVTWLDVADCTRPALRVERASGSADGHMHVDATFLAATSRDAIDPHTFAATDRTGASIVPTSFTIDPNTGKITLDFAGLPTGKHAYTFAANDETGHAAETATATAWIEPSPIDARDYVIYQVMVDRFRDANGNALAAPAVASDRAGGHVGGVRAAIESGALAEMGVNAIWLSPLYANPTGDFPGSDGRPYSSYHGYWPIDSRALDPRTGDTDAVNALIDSAHARGMRVFFDVVPNHIHQQHPYWRAHQADGWFNHTSDSCVCGVGSCDWGTHIQDCWFAPYLPDLDWSNPAVADQIASDVRWWMDTYDADGLRIDAIPMMPRAATRRIAAAVRGKFDHPGHASFLLGENYVGPEGYGLLRYELGPFGLDSEFHFPLMWALRGAIAVEDQPMSDIDVAITNGETDWRGSGAVMATMIGNHDVARFASVANGDGNGDGWTRAAQPPEGSDVYAKQAMALGAVMGLPGAPVVYYGDEIALAGHADPDSRRVMPADADVGASQRGVRSSLIALGRARACSAALRRGTYRLLFADDEHLAFARELDGADTAVAVLTRRASAFSAALPGIHAGTWTDALTGRNASLSPELTNIGAAPLSLQLFFPAGSTCAPVTGP